jgi:1,4-alpha-glucan branching enzyme
MRKSREPHDYVVFICNFTPVVHENYRIGVPELTEYEQLLNSDAAMYGGSGQTGALRLVSVRKPWHNMEYSLSLVVPPLGIVLLKPVSSKL